MVIASIVKAAQMIQKLNKMVEAGMAERSWADNIIKSKFEVREAFGTSGLPPKKLEKSFLKLDHFWGILGKKIVFGTLG